MLLLKSRQKNKRPYKITTPDETIVGSVEKGKSVMITDKYREAKIKDEDGNEIITMGSVPEVYFEDDPLTKEETIDRLLAGERQIIIEVD